MSQMMIEPDCKLETLRALAKWNASRPDDPLILVGKDEILRTFGPAGAGQAIAEGFRRPCPPELLPFLTPEK